MESRRVVLLTEGYLQGWLDFKNKTPLSTLREEILLAEIERRLVSAVKETAIGVYSSVCGRGISATQSDFMQQELDSFLEMRLPYIANKSKINNTSAGKAADAAFWRGILEAKEKVLSQPTSADE